MLGAEGREERDAHDLEYDEGKSKHKIKKKKAMCLLTCVF